MFYGVASLVGDGPAGEYIAYKQIYADLPDIDDIIAKPTTTKVPVGTSVMFAVSSALVSRVDANNFEAIMKYVRRLPVEYQIVSIRDCLAKDPSFIKTPPYTKWQNDNADVLL